MIAGKKVIVVGGGIGGLAFTNSLIELCKERNIELPEIRIYERDASATARSWGYTMGIRDSGGIQAIRKMKLFDKLAKEGGAGVKADADLHIYDKNWNTIAVTHFKHKPGEVAVLPVTRTGCRNVLLSGVPPSMITWNTTCDRAENFTDAKGQTKVRLHMSDGKTDECDILIVADGSKSKIRGSVFPNEQLNFVGVCILSGTAKVAEVPHFLKSGFGFAWAQDGTAVFLIAGQANELMFRVVKEEPVPREGRTVVADASSHVNYNDSTKLSSDQEAIRQEVRELTKAYGEPWPTILSQANTMAIQNLYDKYPHCGVGHMAFIGDSCHPMTPFSGNGANMALSDGWSLADQLTSPKHTTVRSAIRAFEKESHPRSAFAITCGRRAKACWVSTGLSAMWWSVILRTVGRTIGIFPLWATVPIWKALTGLIAVAGIGGLTALVARQCGYRLPSPRLALRH